MRRSAVGLGFGIVLALAVAPASRGDEIVLRGGTVLRGAVLPADPAKPSVVRVLTDTTSRPYEFRKEQVERVTPEDDAISAYAARAAALPETAAAHAEFAAWCRENGLKGPSQLHFKRALELDPEHGGAHAGLGHVQHGGRWMSLADKMRAQGLVQHQGRWVSPQEKERLQGRAASAQDRENWTRRARRLRQMLLGGDPAQAQAAEEELSGLSEPAAAFPILKAFAGDPGPVRLRAAQAVAAIPGREAREGLVQVVLGEVDPMLRQAFFQELASRKEPELIPRLMKALDVKDPAVVGRAAWALSLLDATQAIPRMIRVLVKSEETWVVDPAAGRGGNIGVGFSNVLPGSGMPAGVGQVGVGGATGGTGAVGAVGGGGAPINAPIPGMGVVYPFPVLTGPVVAPGAVAFGATSLPVMDGVAFGNGNPNRPAAYPVTNVYPNEMVLEALVRLTGVDFGFDQAAWRQWLAHARRPRGDDAPGREVREP
jgi:HEAT repeat protein